MVERYITDGLVIPFKVLMVDEAQDLNTFAMGHGC